MKKQKTGIVDAETLRKCFNPPPSIRMIRDLQVRKSIPFMRLGRRVYFDIAEVMAVMKSRGVTR